MPRLRLAATTLGFCLLSLTIVGCADRDAASVDSNPESSPEAQTILPPQAVVDVTDSALQIIDPTVSGGPPVAVIQAQAPRNVRWDASAGTVYWLEDAQFDLETGSSSLDDTTASPDQPWTVLKRSTIVSGQIEELYWSRRSITDLAVQPGGRWLSIVQDGALYSLSPTTGETERLAYDVETAVWSPTEDAVLAINPTAADYILLNDDGRQASHVLIAKDRALLGAVFATPDLVYAIRATDDAVAVIAIDLRSVAITEVAVLPITITAATTAVLQLSPDQTQAAVGVSGRRALLGPVYVVDVATAKVTMVSDEGWPVTWGSPGVVWMLQRPSALQAIDQRSLSAVVVATKDITVLVPAVTAVIPLFAL